MIFDIVDIEEKIEYNFNDKQLLKQAFTHSSYSFENKVKSNEKLEFFGDAILEFIVSKYIFDKFPQLDEGEMTVVRSESVSTKPLYNIIIKLGLDKHILLGVGEKKNGNSEKCYADLFEALLCAIYIDGGLDKAIKFVDRLILKKISLSKPKLITRTKSSENIHRIQSNSDYKSRLQELAQKRKLGDVKYVLTEKKGFDHEPVFEFKVTIDNVDYGIGIGKNKKEATQECARRALENLNKK